jgi:hypothetical protein
MLAICSTTVGAQTQADNTSHPFSISSTRSEFALVATIDGEYRVFPKRIELTVRKVTITLRDNSRYKGPRQLVSLGVGLAVDTSKDGAWKIVEQSKDVSIKRTMRPGDEHIARESQVHR